MDTQLQIHSLKNEKGLVDEESKELIHVKPFNGEVADFVIPMEEVYDWTNDNCARVSEYKREDSWSEIEIEDIKGYGQKLWKEFEPKQRSIINSMAQQFELRKAATSFKKSKISKTGKLNEDKLWAYKITEDLFHQTQIVPQGKNHGILMFVDMSGSMHRQMKGTLEQMETMAMFCRRVNIPFDVYGFSDNGPSGERDITAKQLQGELTAEGGRRDFCFAHLLSSKVNNVQWNDTMAYLQLMKKGYERHRYYNDLADGRSVQIYNRYFRLGGTPLMSALTLAPKLAQRFQKNYNVEKLTTIVLTDGDPTDDMTFVTEEGQKQYYRGEQKFVLKDGAASFSIPSDNDGWYRSNRQENVLLLLEYYKKVTGSTLINFHLLDDNSRRGFESEYARNNSFNKKSRGYIEEDTWKETLAKKFMRVEDDFGYSARFLIKGKGELEIKDEELEVKSNKKGDLLRGFRKFQKGKTTQRVFLNQIIELVA